MMLTAPLALTLEPAALGRATGEEVLLLTPRSYSGRHTSVIANEFNSIIKQPYKHQIATEQHSISFV